MSHLGEFEQLILFAIVELGDDAYGGSIRECIERRTGRVVSSGAIYTALGRMAEKDLVTAEVGEPTGDGPGRPRKYYSIEPEGARALKESYATIQAMAGGLVARLDDLAGKS